MTSLIKQTALFRNLLSNGSSNLVVALLQMLTLSMFARFLPVTLLAEYVLSLAAIALFEVVSDFGSRHWAIRELSKQDSRQRFLQAILLKLFFSILTLIIGVSILYSLQRPLSSALILVLIGITQSASDPLLWQLRAREQMQQEAKIIIVNRLFISFGVISAGIFYSSINAMLIIWLICNLLRIVYEFRIILKLTSTSTKNRKQYPLLTFNFFTIFTALKSTCWIGIAVTVYALYYRFGVWHLDKTATATAVATFGLFFSLASASTIASNTLANVFYPRLSKLGQSSNTSALSEQLNRLLWLFGAIFFTGGLLGTFVHSWVVLIYAGNNYQDSLYLLYLIPWIYLTAFASCLRTAMLAMAFERTELIINVCALSIFVITIHLLSYSMPSVYGIIFGYTISEFFMCLLRVIALWRGEVNPPHIWAVFSGAMLLGIIVLI